jgi:O-acetyl-ADP-ribose deacetylase (regulator of RNase III)
MIEIIKGDLLEAKEKFIAHQCNSISNQAGGLAHYLFKKFPYANIYKNRPYPYVANRSNFPGHCVIKGDGIKNRFVINMLAQYYPGSPPTAKSILDGFEVRESYFNRCLIEISRMENIESIAFPKFVGCGLAGGNWDNYFRMLKSFEIRMNIDQKVRVVIYDNE